MKKLFLIAALLFLLSACSPINNPEYIALESTNTSLLQTIADLNNQVATIRAATPVVKVITPTTRPAQRITNTPARKITNTPAPNYIIETGFCIMSIGPLNSDPESVPGCSRQSREQVYLHINEEMTFTFTQMVNEIQWYCAIFDLSHTFIMVNMDTTGSGKATCHP